ncbi:hypothetical protein BJY24_002942 [Nocardia transvalensis]|uniref:Lipoprotein n=1 Tax=Nocardia transvalensis TaxID=37333 RepID=A0A7W9PDK8_9NOCA|nr:hypothetical protein [Nocardia transvalensis]MBB5914075.1 hypothetical protein [Nocardia transvalensis]
MRISLLAAALIALPLLAGCGGSDHSDHAKISEADLSKSLQDSGLKDAKMADCAAKHYVDQGISQDGLEIMTKPGNNAQTSDPSAMGLSEDDAGKARDATKKIVEDCLK